MMNELKRKLCLVLAAGMVWVTAAAVPSFAYFNRGSVMLSLGQSKVTLAAGASASVSVSIDPIREDQLPGCGMAECPQACGNTGCLNENGECTCAGTEYKTYTSSVSVSSSAPSVASVSYSGGSLTVKGISPGSAVITVTGSMRQYTDASVTLNVSVTGGSAGSSPAEIPGGKTAPRQEPAEGLQVTEIGTNTAVEPDAQGSSGTAVQPPENFENMGELRNTKKGLYRIVELSDSTDTAACFAKAAEEKSHLMLQKKKGNNVAWSWTFDAQSADPALTAAFSPDLVLSSQMPESAGSLSGGSSVCTVKFQGGGRLPGPAQLYLNVSEYFPEHAQISLYTAAPAAGETAYVKSDQTLAAENGYVSFTIEEAADCILTEGKLLKAESSWSAAGSIPWLPAGIGALAAAAAGAGCFYFRKKQKDNRKQ